ncbi:MAG: endonuclease, partial [Oscillospiraceae bacterium]|nr:endonuclease [Oscillospiraceae bacterium]
MKRCLSIALVLSLLLGLFGGIRPKAEAASYLYNTGKRGQVCTELSSYAQNYYTGSYSFENLSEMSSGNLRSALYKLVNTDKRDLSYNDLREYLPYTDADQSNSGNLILFYTNHSQVAQWANGRTWNREHMWPDSQGGSALEGDLHAMRPTDEQVNSKRGSLPYGDNPSGSPAYASDTNNNLLGGYSGGCFEPLDFAKGDCARTILYDYVAQTTVDVVKKVFENTETLLRWCEEDPVDAFEMSRNDSAQSIQNNRNPFVDYPELAWILLGKEVPADLVSPGSGAVSFTITAKSSNTAHGTVSLSGRRILAQPAEGYYAAGYTVTKGTATVTQNGNVFTVQAESDCEILIRFEKKTVVTVGFFGVAPAVTAYAGEPVILPEGQEEEGYRFVGWTETSVSATTQKPAYYEAGAEYIPNGNVDLYALYSYADGGVGTGWSLVQKESQLYAGARLVIAHNTKGRVAGNLKSGYLASVEQSFVAGGEVVQEVAAEALILTLGGGSGAWTFSDPEGKLLGVTSAKNLAWGSGETAWTVSVSAEGALIASNDGSCGRFLYNSGSPRFTTYTSNLSSSMLLPQLYINDGGVLYYTTELTRCEHETMSYTAPKAATCTAGGNVAYYTCTACGRTFADREGKEPLNGTQLVIAPLGHEAGEYRFDTESHWQICTRCAEVCTEKEAHIWD